MVPRLSEIHSRYHRNRRKITEQAIAARFASDAPTRHQYEVLGPQS